MQHSRGTAEDYDCCFIDVRVAVVVDGVAVAVETTATTVNALTVITLFDSDQGGGGGGGSFISGIIRGWSTVCVVYFLMTGGRSKLRDQIRRKKEQ